MKPWEEVVPSQDGERTVAPIRRTRLVDEAAQAIRDAILTGKLPLGARLWQVELARQMGISRTPLREALMKLEQEGLVSILPAGGLRVALHDLDEAVELYDIREVLDGLAARLAAQRIDPTEVGGLKRHLTNMEACVKTQDAHDWFLHHVAFHQEIFEASGNGRLAGMVSVIRLSIQRFHPLLLTTPTRLRDAHREHRAIFKAIAAHDPETAERLARTHISAGKEIVLKVMASGFPKGDFKAYSP